MDENTRTSTKFQVRAQLFKQTRCRENEISIKSRPHEEFAGKSERSLKSCLVLGSKDLYYILDHLVNFYLLKAHTNFRIFKIRFYGIRSNDRNFKTSSLKTKISSDAPTNCQITFSCLLLSMHFCILSFFNPNFFSCQLCVYTLYCITLLIYNKIK